MRPILLVALLPIALACGGQPGNGTGAADLPVRRAELGREFELRPGETGVVEGANVRVRFDRVRQDSRCPVDVQCVWAGDAELDLRVWTSAGDSADAVVHSGVEPRAAPVGDLEVRLESLLPQPTSGTSIAQSDYVARFVVRARQ